jgi:hypothetical protein
VEWIDWAHVLTRTRNLESMVSIGNVLWVVFFGWILYIGYALAALVMCITIAGIPYGTSTPHTCTQAHASPHVHAHARQPDPHPTQPPQVDSAGN